MNNLVKFEQFYKLLASYEIFLEVTQNRKTDFKNFKKLQEALQAFEEEVLQQAGISITVHKLSELLRKLQDIHDLLTNLEN